MPFPFAHVCDLLQQVADLPPARRSQARAVNAVVQAWFQTHRAAVDGLIASSSAPPLLSALLPDRRTDRVYGIQAPALQRILVRALGLGRSRVAELSRWARPNDYGDAVDLADCVEAILKRTPNPYDPGAPPVTVEEVDALLHRIAARCRFSAPAVRSSREAAADGTLPPPTTALGHLFLRLDARGAKWLTRLVLKDFRPVALDGAAVARAFHPELPLALQVHADLEAAARSLHREDGEDDNDGNDDQGQRSCNDVSSLHERLRPRLGVKVGRQQWAKGRSIKHCIEMGGPQRMSCERKMDGEYVQVHVNLEGGTDNCLQLFSKSGKDSTWDRVYLHSAIRESLRIGQPDCKLKKGCILEGEMLAYDERESKIMDFDAIRKHVNRSGSMLYCDTRAETQDHEHLMIVYYDLLLVDDESLLATRHSDRFRRLEDLITCRPGYAEMVQREVIDFRYHTAAKQLRRAFARCITARLEGLVIKPDDDPYFDFSPPGAKSAALKWPYLKSYVIKLKKEYIGAFGEVGDFAIVGGRYDAAKAMEYPADLPGLRWTHFFLGCLDKEAPTARRPRFVVTNVVTLTVPQMTTFLRQCRPHVVPVERKRDRRKTRGAAAAQNPRARAAPESDAEFDAAVRSGERAPFDLAPIEPGLDESRGGPTELFADPPVVDIRCFSFHRQGYGRFWSPRFPSVMKFHFDRTYADALTFSDLQAMAKAESTRRSEVADAEAAEDADLLVESQAAAAGDEERAHWETQLKRADPRGIPIDAETSQSSGAATMTTARSQSSSGHETSQLASATMPAAGISLIEIIEEEDGERDSQASAATAKPTQKEKEKPEVTIIDLTEDDDEDDEDDEDENSKSREERVTTPTPLPSSLPLPRSSPATPRTTPPSSPPPPPSSASPAHPMSCPVSHATTPASASETTTDASNHSQDGNQGEGGNDRSSPQSSPPGSRSSKNRARTWDVASLLPIVSPPQLKRARSLKSSLEIERETKRNLP